MYLWKPSRERSMEDTDFALRLALISAERLHRMANSQVNREAILAEANLLQHRLGLAITSIEDHPDWKPSEGILPE